MVIERWPSSLPPVPCPHFPVPSSLSPVCCRLPQFPSSLSQVFCPEFPLRRSLSPSRSFSPIPLAIFEVTENSSHFFHAPASCVCASISVTKSSFSFFHFQAEVHFQAGGMAAVSLAMPRKLWDSAGRECGPTFLYLRLKLFSTLRLYFSVFPESIAKGSSGKSFEH